MCAFFAVSVTQIQGALLHPDLLRCLPKKRILLAPTVYPVPLVFLLIAGLLVLPAWLPSFM